MQLKGMLAVLLALSLANPAASHSRKLSQDLAPLHALNRLAFGPTHDDLEEVRRIGVSKWIDLQLHPERIPERPELAERLAPLASLQLENEELVRRYPPPRMVIAYATGRLPMPSDPEQQAMIKRLFERYKAKLEKKGVEIGETEKEMTPRSLNRAPQQLLARDLQEGKLYRAVYSNRQLEEVLTDFWFNHFNVFLNRGADRFLTTAYERDAIRPHVLGKFRELLQATAQDPAMLFYLDNWQSASPDAPMPRRAKAGKSQAGKGKTRGLNENYARELLELHTLGVDGGYTQQDIVEVARCFTGWTIAKPYEGATFTFNERLHDNGQKTVLGKVIPAGGGIGDGLKVLDILSAHPSTAMFISRKLAQRFVSDTPPDSLVRSMAETFRKTDGDLRRVMQTMVASPAFWSEDAYRAKVKTPFEMVVSALRATRADVHSAHSAVAKIAELGQPLYRKQEPTGYSNTTEEWVNSGALLARMNFALALAKNELPGVTVDTSRFSEDLDSTARALLFVPPSEQTRSAIERGLSETKDPATIAGLLLGSPEFQRK